MALAAFVSSMAAAAMSLPAGGPACTAAGAQYRLAGAPEVAAALGKLPFKHGSLSDLYLRVEVAPGDVMWFTMDRGNGHRGAFLHSSASRLDSAPPPDQAPDYVVRSVSVTFFDHKGTEVNDIVRSGDPAPPYFFLSNTDWPRNAGEAPERRPFPAKLGSAMFVLGGCLGAAAESGRQPVASRK